ncbi:MAG: hypothetical protein IJ475_03765 [Bacilli bacterium]|nr:hypothetical protein [Bacilli bacterium]
MAKKKADIKIMITFVLGLIIYLVGLFLLFWSGLSKSGIIEVVVLTNNVIKSMKVFGIILFIIGFILFMWSVILLYKKDKIVESNRELLVEGKADVITIIVTTYIMIVMLVVCLVFDQVIGALLFGITIVIQSVLNSILVKYFNRRV